jgi:hypothetical protein
MLKMLVYMWSLKRVLIATPRPTEVDMHYGVLTGAWEAYGLQMNVSTRPGCHGSPKLVRY